MRVYIKREKGITLIALVITIIVLLILSGITISALSGENGILIKAKEAKTENEVEEIKERVKIDILGTQSDNLNSDITKKQFIEILENYFNNVPTEKDLPTDLSTLSLMTKSKYGNYTIKISDIWNGTFGSVKVPQFDENALTIGTDAQNTDKYGWRVPEYTVTTEEFTTGVWRLFYQDSNYTYLITDESIGEYKPSDYCSNYTSGADVSVVGRRLNPMLNSLFTSSSGRSNVRATAWLTDTRKSGMWSKYKNKDAVFAIGSPTVELLVASFNNRINKTHQIILATGDYGYKIKKGSSCKLDNGNNGIYGKYTDKYTAVWLASPSEFNDDRFEKCLSIIGSDVSQVYVDRQYWDNGGFSVRPIVCILTSVFNGNYTLEAEGENLND